MGFIYFVFESAFLSVFVCVFVIVFVSATVATTRIQWVVKSCKVRIPG